MKKSVPVLIPFLVFVATLFIGILIFAYVETKKANPQMIEVGEVPRPGPCVDDVHALRTRLRQRPRSAAPGARTSTPS